MAKLVQLINSETNENIYPKTPIKAIVNADGSNISTINGILKGDGAGNVTAADGDFVVYEPIADIEATMTIDADTLNGKTYDNIKDYVDNSVVHFNLIKNGYFGNPVNSQGKTKYTSSSTGNTACIDNWAIQFVGTEYDVTTATLSTTSTSTVAQLNYTIPYNEAIDLVGKELTFSALLDNSANTTGTLLIYDKGNWVQLIPSVSGTGNFLTTTGILGNLSAGKDLQLSFNISNNSSVIIKAIKLEFGNEQTLVKKNANGEWILREIPDYYIEAARCGVAFNRNQVNPNLLDNSLFYIGVINQRGASSYTAAGYCIDRWKKSDATTKIVVNSKTVGYDRNGHTGLPYIYQILDPARWSAFPNMPWTLTIKCSSSNTVSYRIGMNIQGYLKSDTTQAATTKIIYSSTSSTDYNQVVHGNFPTGNEVTINGEVYVINNLMIFIQLTDTSDTGVLTINGMKLEIGYQSTLLLPMLNGSVSWAESPSAAEELLKCQRYFQVITSSYDTGGNGVAIGYANNTIDFWVDFPLIAPMRTSPTPAISDISLFKVGKTSSSLKDITKATGGWATRTDNGCNMRSIMFTSSGLAAGESYVLFMKKGATLILTAEL